MPRKKTISSAPKKPRKRRAALIALILLGAVLALLWLQRYALIELYARHKIKQMGYDTDFTVTAISGERLTIEDIQLSQAKDTFFAAQSINADYTWREALKGQIISLDIDKASLSVAVDETGKITSPWLPQGGSGETALPALPQKGIKLTQGTIKLQSPYGNFESRLDADIKTLSDMSATLTAPEQSLVYDGADAALGGTVNAALKGTDVTIALDVTAPRFRGRTLSGSGLSLAGQITTDTDALFKDITADITIGFDALSADAVRTGQGTLTWDGRVTTPNAQTETPSANGRWSADIKSVTPQDAAQVKTIAEALTLNETLSGLSSTAPFAPGLTRNIEQFLSTVDVKSSGTLIFDETKTVIDISEPLVIKGGKEMLSLSGSKPDTPLYSREASSPEHKVTFDADFTGSYGLTLSGADVTISTQNSPALKQFSGKLSTKRTWRALTDAGRRARLAPLSAQVSYTAGPDIRTVTAAGAIDFDGDVPGGYGQGLKARGRLGLTLKGDDLTARFRAAKNAPVTVSRLETSSDWIVTDGLFHLAPQDLIYDRHQRRRVTTKLRSGTGTLVNSIDGRDMAFTFEDTDVTGALSDPQQDWIIDANAVHLTSDTFPSPGTDIRAPKAHITARLIPERPITFTIDAPQTSVKTELVSAAKLAVKAEGSAEDLYVTYNEGVIKFSAGDLPALPLEGDVRYRNETWAGKAVTFLPRAKLSPIDVSYTFKDGRGEADVVITDLPFKPSGLQPKHLVPAITGKVSRVDGLLSSNIHIEFGAGEPLLSLGTATIKNMNTGTLPGPIKGINSTMTFSSLFPVATDGPQTLTLESFDPGFPLENGTVTFEIVPDGIKIQSAKWPMGGGFLSLEPTTWLYSAPQNRVVLAVEDIALGEFLNGVGGGNIKATGDVSGRLPVIIEGINLRVENGRIAVKNGGVIQYSSPQTNAAAQSNQYAGYAFDALKNFEYEELEAELNGPMNGPMKLRLVFNGSNPDVLYGSEFKFNIGVEGELLNILRSFSANSTFNNTILQQIKNTSPRVPPSRDDVE